MIRFLQVYPIITALAFLVDTILDAVGIVITDFMGAVFGVSLLPLICLWYHSRQLKVSLWSRMLYATLFGVTLVFISDRIFEWSLNAVVLDGIVFIILVAGIISSFLTYIYTKYRNHGNF